VQELSLTISPHKEKGDRAFPRHKALKFVRSGKGLAQAHGRNRLVFRQV